MKPVKLEMINFGPYRHETIDFTKFEEGSLFLISGRTGSGKSSIFDAMLYALYNVTSGDREIGELRSTFAALKDARTQVIFQFEHQDKLYRVQRTLELMPKKGIDRGKGIGTKEASLVLLEQTDGRELVHLASQNIKTTKAVEDLLQLSAEQFKQIILLPQYQFSQFLKSGVEAKREILRQIFGTQIFRDFEEKLAERNKSLTAEQQALNLELEKQFQNESVWTQTEIEAFAETDGQRRRQLAEDFLKNHQAEQSSLTLQVKEAEELKNKAFKDWTEGQKTAELFADLKEKEAQYARDIQAQEEQQQKNRQLLERLEFANHLKDAHSKMIAANRRTAELERSIAKLKEEISTAAANYDSCRTAVSSLKQKEPHQEKEYQALPEIRQQLEAAKQLQDYQQKRKSSAKNIDTLKEKGGRLKQEEKKNKQELEAANRQQNALTERIAGLSGVIRQAEELIKYHLDKSIEDQTRFLKEKDSLEEKLSRTRRDLAAAEAELSRLQQESRGKKKDQLKLMIGKLQAELTQGEACPVCGSLEHPNTQIAETDEENLKLLFKDIENLEQQIKAAEQRVQELNNLLAADDSRKKDVLKELKKIAEAVAAAYQDLQNTVSQTAAGDLKENYSKAVGQAILADLRASHEELENRQKLQEQTIEKLEAALDNNQTEQQTSLKNLSVETDRLEQAEGKILELQESYPDLKSAAYYQKLEDTIKEAYQTFKESLTKAETALHQSETALSKLKGQLTSESETLTAQQKEGTDAERELDEALLPDTALTHDRQQLADWIAELGHNRISVTANQISRFEEQKRSLSQEIAELQEGVKDKAYPELDSLEKKKEEAEQNHLSLVEKQGRLSRQLQMIAETVQAIADKQKEAEKNRQAAQELAYLNKLVQGQGESHVRLETYVIQAHLERILDYANNHYIGLLSSQQFEFLISDRTAGKAQSGLNINIYDKTNNKELPASSLSGGETFIASLAIALSMSEVVQNASNGALIETLFIDEGFGSLDEETLDKAVAVLESIGENRMVGVISHVKEMKETIEQQLLIEKRIDGSSAIKHRT
ncbi:AAA family ATPase [Streptococcus pantholopis]|uniref:Nuclease SbcCD subunit C n=1 Tax=Streptococcus pantholopis TaxID=1811193 RepID=A0A172Q9A4_9STRE|nr:AAA family ATPase [Streptococcus pantholopis]AND80036.1 hypothetical protein A0O21_08490 [Streptococcus pantholopis]